MNGLQKTLAAAGIVLASTASAFALGDNGGGCGGCGSGGGTSNGGSGPVVAQTCDSTWVRRGHLKQADVDQNSAKRRAFTKMSQKADGICGGFDEIVCKSGKVRDAFAGSVLACPNGTTVIIREPAPKTTAPVVVAPKEKPAVVVPKPRPVTPAPKTEAPAACPTSAATKVETPVCSTAPAAKAAAPLASFDTTFNLDQAAMDKFCADQFATRAAIPATPATPVAPAAPAAPTSGAPTQTAGTPASATPSVGGTLNGTCQATVGADGRTVQWRFVPTR